MKHKKVGITLGIFSLIFLIVFTNGCTMMFAKKSGEEVRENIAKSKLPFLTFIKEIIEVKLETLRFFHDKFLVLKEKINNKDI